MKIVAGDASPELAAAVARKVGLPLTERELSRFADGERFVQILENARGEDVFVIQSTCPPVDERLMTLLIMIDALKRASAQRITAVIPYFGYARQDRKSAPRTPISAKLVANLIARAGADRVLTLDLHAGAIQGFFDLPVDNLQAAPSFAHDLTNRRADAPEPLALVSPDVGGVARARGLAMRLGGDLAFADKFRPVPGEASILRVIGEVEGRECVIIDDMVDSAGTLTAAARVLRDQGAARVRAYATHGVLSGPALERIAASPLEDLTITDSIPPRDLAAEADARIRRLSIAHLIGEAITRIADSKSVSALFDAFHAEDVVDLFPLRAS